MALLSTLTIEFRQGRCKMKPDRADLQNRFRPFPVAPCAEFAYHNVMADARVTDPFISTEPDVEVDTQTAAAIGRGIRAAEEGHVVPAEQVRQLIHQWISSFSIPTQR